MKAVFRCDYCSEMGAEEEIQKHEPECLRNYDRKSCYTCEHASSKWKDGMYSYECSAGVEVKPGCRVEFCDSYKQKQMVDAAGFASFRNLFGF